jgi:hypothetical protein
MSSCSVDGAVQSDWRPCDDKRSASEASMKTGELLGTRSAVDRSIGSLGRALGVASGLVPAG